MDDLRQEWKNLYAKRLPAMAKARDGAQKHWPVYLDHCFARIILDNAVGKDVPWTEAIKSPAVKHMSEQQLKDAIKLGESIASGDDNINDLNERSLELRGKQGPGKKRKANDNDALASKKVKSEMATDQPARKEQSGQPAQKKQTGTLSAYFLPSPQSDAKHEASAKAAEDVAEASKQAADEDVNVQLKRIADSKITPFRKQTLSMLCQIPRGRYSTYQAMSDYITKTSHKTCARAVGNAMRNNPFAPEVPCHRILAADGTLGGFGGHWGEEGKFAAKKHELLHDEGVRFDSRGKVKGPPFHDFAKVGS